MTHRGHRFLVLLFVLLGPTCVQAQGLELIDFNIEDQFDRSHRYTEYRGKIVVIVDSDKDGSEFNPLWSSAIHESLKNNSNYNRIVFLPVADVRGAPFFLKGFVKGKFPQNKNSWVLLDWDGHFARAYRFQPKTSNIVIFDADGKLLHSAHGRDVDGATLAEIIATLRVVLNDPSLANQK